MNLNRASQPEISSIETINIPELKMITAPNGVEIYILNMGDQDVSRIDLMFSAGKWEQDKKLVAMFTNLLLKEGAGKYSSSQLAEMLDYYGAWLQPSATFHNSYMTLYSLNKHIKNTLPLLEMIIKNPLFEEKEFEIMVQRRKQQFCIEDEKVNVQAYNKFVEQLYGEDHPYGQYAVKEDFDKLNINDIKSFHTKYYGSENCRIVLTGKISDNLLNDIIEFFGKDKWGNVCNEKKRSFEILPSTPGISFIKKDDALQSAVRIGLPVIGRENPDYYKLRVVNTILGGYFGSRLMTSIREELGYTYSIGSSITTLKYGSYLSISSQTATEYTMPLIDAVFAEIEKLKNEIVDEYELLNLKGYLMGEIARLFDGPFSISDAYLALLANDMDVSYYKNMIEAIKSVTSEDIIFLTKKYLLKEKFYIVICGKKE